MNLSLPRDLEEFVRKEVAAGQYPDANAVVVDALRELQLRSGDDVDGGEASCPPELKKVLLEAVNGPHHPLPANYFENLREHVRTGGKE